LNAPTTEGARLFTIVGMFVGILLIFSYLKNIIHILAGVLKERLLPGLNLEHYVSAMLGVSLVLLVLDLLLGTFVMQFNENLSFITALYFAVYTATVRTIEINYDYHTPFIR